MTTLSSYVLPTHNTTFATLSTAKTSGDNAAVAEYGALSASGHPLTDAGLTSYLTDENKWYAGQFNVPGTSILVNKWLAYGAVAAALYVLMK